MNYLLIQLQQLLFLMKDNVPTALAVVSVFWVIFLLSLLTARRLNLLGIYPRRWYGLPGIVFAPFLHDDFNHLFFNSVPLFVLTDFILIEGIPHFITVSAVIILFSGSLIWLFGRAGIHIGASALIMGYLGYLLAKAYQQPSIVSIIIAMVCIYYFGSLLLGLFPTKEKISWEGHLFGFVTGLAAAFLV